MKKKHTMSAATLTLNPSLDRTMYFDRGFVSGALNRASAPSVLTLGSKGINVTRAWAAMGVQAPAYIFSGGSNGAMMESMLDEESMPYVAIHTDAETRMNIKMIAPGGICTEANERGGPIGEDELSAMLLAIKNGITGADDNKKFSTGDAQIWENNPESTENTPENGIKYMALGGSIPQGVDTAVYNSVTELCNSCGVKVLLDCDGQALKEGITAKPYLIKPNLYELSGLVGRDITDPAEACMICGELSVKSSVNILCTMSEKGALWASEGRVWRARSPQGLPVRGFTGAGDTFLAAFTYKFDETNDPAEALRFASSASAAKITLPGSQIPTLEEMEQYLDQVSVTEVG